MNLKSKKIASIATILYIFLLLFLFISTLYNTFDTNIENGNQFNCDNDIYASLADIKSLEKSYLLNVDFVSYFPEVENLKCFGKIKSISLDENGYLNINIQDSIRAKALIMCLSLYIIYFLFLKNQGRKYQYFLLNAVNYLVVSTFLNKFIFSELFDYSYLISSIFVGLIIMLYDNKRVVNSLLIFYITYFIVIINSVNLDVLLNNEIHYVGQLMSSQQELSSYLDNPRQNFNLVIQLLNINIILIRVVTFLLAAFAVYSLNKSFKLTNLQALISVSLFFGFNQSFVGGNYMFGYIEPRIYYYIFFLLSMSLLINNKLKYSILLFIVAFYFHQAEGILYLPIYLFTVNKLKKVNLLLRNWYLGILTIPIIYQTINSIPNVDKRIYTHFITERAPHHLYPFTNDSFQFLNNIWESGVKVFIASFLLIYICRLFTNQNQLLFSIASFTGSLVLIYFLILYYFPVSKFAVLGPYRIITFYTFTSVAYIIASIFRIDAKYLKTVFNSKMIILIVVLLNFYLVSTYGYNAHIERQYFNQNTQLVKAIIDLNPNLILIDNETKNMLNDIEYRTKLPTYYQRKFVPHDLSYYDEWLERSKVINSIFNEEKCTPVSNKEKILLITTKSEIKCGDFNKNIGKYYLFDY